MVWFSGVTLERFLLCCERISPVLLSEASSSTTNCMEALLCLEGVWCDFRPFCFLLQSRGIERTFYRIRWILEIFLVTASLFVLSMFTPSGLIIFLRKAMVGLWNFLCSAHVSRVPTLRWNIQQWSPTTGDLPSCRFSNQNLTQLRTSEGNDWMIRWARWWLKLK